MGRGANTEPLDGPSLACADRDHALHPRGRLHLHEDTSFILESDGVHIQDGKGNRLLYGVAGLWCVNIGYRRAEMASAIADRVMKLPFYNSFMEMGNAPSVELSAALATADPGEHSRVFLTTGGSTANDSAIRFVHLVANRTGISVTRQSQPQSCFA